MYALTILVFVLVMETNIAYQLLDQENQIKTKTEVDIVSK